MKVNAALMATARFERKLVSELTVAEFRKLMQECFNADRIQLERQKYIDKAFRHYFALGLSQPDAYARANAEIGKPQ
jgi:uncharacterized protein with von Willebrand factor type A (vWA) domain